MGSICSCIKSDIQTFNYEIYEHLRKEFSSKLEEITRITSILTYHKFKKQNLQNNEHGKRRNSFSDNFIRDTKKYIYLSKIEGILTKIIYILEIQILTILESTEKRKDSSSCDYLLIFDTGNLLIKYKLIWL